MGNVLASVDPPDNDEAVAAEMRDALCARGSAFQPADTLTVSVDRWRAIARRVGRELKRPIQTLEGDDGVHAVLADWPRDEQERAISDRAIRAAVAAIAWTDRSDQAPD